RHTWLQEGKLEEAAPIDRQLLNLLAGDHAIDRVRLQFDLAGGAGDGHHLARLTDLHAQVDRQDRAGGDGHVALERPEAGELCDHFVLTGGESRDREGAVVARGQRALDAGGLVANGDGGGRDNRAGLVADHARDRPDWRLRPRTSRHDEGQTAASATNE